MSLSSIAMLRNLVTKEMAVWDEHSKFGSKLWTFLPGVFTKIIDLCKVE